MRKLLFLILPVALVLAACTAPKAPEAEVTDATSDVAMPRKGNYAIDPAASRVTWIGTKLSGRHTGTIPVTEGSIELEGTTVKAGNAMLAVNQVIVTDLTGDYKAKLEGHLRSPDFFHADSFPTAEFMILETVPMTQDSAGANTIVKGRLIIRGVSKGIRFPANIRMQGDSLVATANFNIDRQQWGIKYAGKQDDLIRDEVNLDLALRAFPVQPATPAPATPAAQ